MEKMFGPGGMKMYAGAIDSRTVLIAYTSTDLLEKAWESAESTSTLSRNEALQQVSEKLPSDAQMVGYWSPSGTSSSRPVEKHRVLPTWLLLAVRQNLLGLLRLAS
ncbi:hypothetical protein CGZ80_25915 [Rhodopirellula sp. MGV]|nr:hypothetical protein CGZ80_25915 [Rhodopirellula sp. MGV]